MSSHGTPSSSVKSPARSSQQSRRSGPGDDLAESSSQAESRGGGSRNGLSPEWADSGKLSSEPRSSQEDDRQRVKGVTGHGARRSGGFLLASAFDDAGTAPRASGNADRKSNAGMQNGQLHIEKRHPGRSKLSAGTSTGISPLSREISLGQSEDMRPQDALSGTSSIDPQRLVQMALSLSESRRRNVSNTLQLPQPGVAGRRLASAASPMYDTFRPSPTTRRRSERLRDQRSPRPSRDDEPLTHDYAEDADEADNGNVVYTFSAATEARAEKARRYFELANEHRRMLSFLPPLKPDSTAPGNYMFSSTNSPGTTFPQITRTESFLGNKHKLGRPYNPLQALRNRRTRVRERRPLLEPPEAWNNLETTKRYVDTAEDAAQKSDYRTTHNTVRLPLLSDRSPSAPPSLSQQSTQSHRRTDTASSKIAKGDSPWSIDPSELLADAIWLEQGDNKLVIENRHGYRIFPRAPRPSPEQPRRSKELTRLANKDAKDTDSDDTKERGRNKLSLLSIYKHNGNSRNRSHSSSSASGSNFSSRKRRGKPSDHAPDMDENVGPLQRHMEQMIARDERGELSSPELVSPDHWDSQPTSYQSLEAQPQLNGRTGGVAAAYHHRRSRSAEPTTITAKEQPRSSFDAFDSTEPNSPVIASHVPAIGMDLSPPYSRHSSPARKSKESRLPFFRASTKDHNRIDHNDFAAEDKLDHSSSRHGSGDIVEDVRSSYESARPHQMKRHKTGETLAGSLHRAETSSKRSAKEGSFKEQGSTVGRFFKGGRIGDIVRGESNRLGDFIWSRDKLADSASVLSVSREASDASDTDDSDHETAGLKHQQPIARRSGDDSMDTSPRTSLDRTRTKPKYYMPNLPVFKSPSASNGHSPGGTWSPSSDPIGRQQAAQREAGRSTRFDRLAPPRINLVNFSQPFSDAGEPPADTLEQDRRDSYGFLAPRSHSATRKSTASLGMLGQIGRRGGNALPMTGLATVSTSYEHSPSRPGIEGKRHWSISNRMQSEQLASDKVTSRDIARVRALLLSSGVKAREIQFRADTIQDPPSAILVNATRTAGSDEVRPVMRKEEHVIAARFLSKSLSASIRTLESSLTTFDHDTAKTLHAQVDALVEKVAVQLTPRLHQAETEADTFLSELTSTKTVSVKDVDDLIDAMLRNRRREFRLLRRLGFKLLEWLVLSVMWWVWFVVVLFNSAKSVVVGLWRIVKWLLWL